MSRRVVAIGAAGGIIVAAIALAFVFVNRSVPVPPSRPTAAVAAPVTAALGVPFPQSEMPRPVPPVAFTNDDGKRMGLDDFRGAVLLNVWATWCVPCRKEMPALDRLQAKLGGRDFHVVPVSIDRQGLAVVKPFYRQLGIKSLGIYLDPAAGTPAAIDTVDLPTTLLIDDNGDEVARKLGPVAWDKPEAIAQIRAILHWSGTSAGAAQ